MDNKGWKQLQMEISPVIYAIKPFQQKVIYYDINVTFMGKAVRKGTLHSNVSTVLKYLKTIRLYSHMLKAITQ